MSNDDTKSREGAELKSALSFNSAPNAVSVHHSPWLYPLLALLVAESLFLIMKVQGIGIHVPAIPLRFGLIKDIADMVIVVLLPWHGWVFAIPLLVIFAIGAKGTYLMMIYLLSTILTATISSLFNFSDLSLEKIATGILTYSAINLSVFLFFFLLKLTIKGVLRCRR